MTTRRNPLARKKSHSSFESIIYWLGMIVVLTFLGWAILMVLLQAFQRHSR